MRSGFPFSFFFSLFSFFRDLNGDPLKARYTQEQQVPNVAEGFVLTSNGEHGAGNPLLIKVRC